MLEWRESLLAECRSRAELNAAVKAEAEEVFRTPVTLASPPGEARLTPALIWLSREELTRRALNLGANDLLERVSQAGGQVDDHRTGTYLMAGLASDAELKQLLKQLIDTLAECSETRAAAEAHEELRAATVRAWRTIEGHLMRHKLPGRCEWCPTGI